jgi:hypothetical protein
MIWIADTAQASTETFDAWRKRYAPQGKKGRPSVPVSKQ